MDFDDSLDFNVDEIKESGTFAFDNDFQLDDDDGEIPDEADVDPQYQQFEEE